MATVSNLIIGVLVMGIVAFGLITYLSSNVGYYDIEMNPAYEGYFDNMTANVGAIENLSRGYASSVEKGATTSTDTGLSLSVSAIWGVIKAPFQLINHYSNFITTSIGIIGVPKPIVNFFLAALFITVLFTVINIVVRSKT